MAGLHPATLGPSAVGQIPTARNSSCRYSSRCLTTIAREQKDEAARVFGPERPVFYGFGRERFG